MHREVLAGRTGCSPSARCRRDDRAGVLYTDPARASWTWSSSSSTWGGPRPDKWDVQPLDLRRLKASLGTLAGGLAERGWNSLLLEQPRPAAVVSRFGDDGEHRVRSARRSARCCTCNGERLRLPGRGARHGQRPRGGPIDDFRDVESVNHYGRRDRRRTGPRRCTRGPARHEPRQRAYADAVGRVAARRLHDRYALAPRPPPTSPTSMPRPQRDDPRLGARALPPVDRAPALPTTSSRTATSRCCAEPEQVYAFLRLPGRRRAADPGQPVRRPGGGAAACPGRSGRETPVLLSNLRTRTSRRSGWCSEPWRRACTGAPSPRADHAIAAHRYFMISARGCGGTSWTGRSRARPGGFPDPTAAMLPDMSWISESSSELGEGPCWHRLGRSGPGSTSRGGVLHRYDPSTGEETEQQVARTLSFALPTQDPDELVVGTERGIELYGPGGLRTIRPWEWKEPSHRFNDAVRRLRRVGLSVGCMHSDGLPGEGTLHHVDNLRRRAPCCATASPSPTGWPAPRRRRLLLRGHDGEAQSTSSAQRRRAPPTRSRSARRKYPGMPDGMTADAGRDAVGGLLGRRRVRRFLGHGASCSRSCPWRTPLVTSAALGWSPAATTWW
jgi:hypothetical protein